ncbi:MAG TPA: ParB/RepB/Spo0J family partition protein [Actinomycetota bacterium]|nr:ParB/RepB/Spo0J family partition protein [Actinomycetota bacterium]
MTRRGGLGRGLDALLPAGDEHTPAASGPRTAPVDAIEPNPRQPRRTFDDDALAELAASIRSLGVLQPLVVRERPGGALELVAGERRLRAARRAGLDEVPVVVVDTDDDGSLERALVENLQREDLDPLEEAHAYRALLTRTGMTQEELGARVGKSRAAIANSLRLLELPESIQALLVDGRLTAGHARALLPLAGNPFQERLARRVAHEGLTVRDAEELVRRYGAMTAPRPASGASERARPALAAEAQRRLTAHLGTRVRVDVGARKGKIVVDFASLDDLARLLDTLLGAAARGDRPDD